MSHWVFSPGIPPTLTGTDHNEAVDEKLPMRFSHQGHHYSFKRFTKDCIKWKCIHQMSQACKGTVTTDRDRENAVVGQPHSHPPGLKSRKCSSRRPRMKNKERTKKPKVTSHICDICNKSFYDAANPHRHKKGHSEDQRCVCSICGLSLKRKEYLDMHMTIHTGVRKFTCLTCGAGFNSRNGLAAHENKHRGEKPYQCDVCGKSFFDKRILRKHQFIQKSLQIVLKQTIWLSFFCNN